jgi:hypothetical protein
VKVIIDRRKWNTGKRLAEPKLLDELTGSMCCLGFLGLACGATRNDLADECLPGDVRKVQRLDGLGETPWPEALFGRTDAFRVGCNTWENILSMMNDVEGIDHADREPWIAEGFKTVLGVEVEFVGDYGDGT